MNESHFADSMIKQSVVIENYQTQQTSMFNDLKDQIIELQKTQKLLKQSIIETDVCLKSPQMRYRQSLLQQCYQKQKQNYASFSQLFKHLQSHQRRPYETMFRKFKQKLNQHAEQIRLAIEEPQQHKKKLQNVKQIWFENQQSEQEDWKFLLRGLIGIFGAFLCHVMIGSINRWTIINPYITSYYKISTDPNIQTKKNAFVGPLSMFFTGLMMKFGLRQCNKFSPIIMIAISTIGIAGSAFASTFVDEIAEYLIFNNVINGMLGGMIFLTALRQCHRYFPKYRLVCNSVILMGTGIGAVSFGVFNTHCMNPNHQKAMQSGYFQGQKAHIANSFPMCWKEMSIVILIIGAVGMLCFYPLVAYNRKQEQIKLQKGQVPDFQNSCYTDEQAVKSKVFWVLVALVFCSSFGNYFITANYKNYVKPQKDPIFKNDDYMIMVLLTGFLCAPFFGLFWGLAFKSIGFKYVYMIAICLDIIVFTCLLTVNLNEVTYILLFATHFIVQGGWFVIFPNVCLLVFGNIIGESIYGFYYACFAFTSFSQYLVSVNIADITLFIKNNLTFFTVPENNMKIPLYPAIFLLIIGGILCSVTKFQGRWENSQKFLTFSCEQNHQE